MGPSIPFASKGEDLQIREPPSSRSQRRGVRQAMRALATRAPSRVRAHDQRSTETNVGFKNIKPSALCTWFAVRYVCFTNGRRSIPRSSDNSLSLK